MMPIRKSAGLLVGALLLCLGLSAPGLAADPPAVPAAPAAATQTGALYQLHVGAGLNCASCHKETPPATPVGTATCLSCHGSYEALAKKTISVTPNPHDSHQGQLPCESCHHIHKPSVDFCSQCHQWGFKVP
jgi:hypothetical protein